MGAALKLQQKEAWVSRSPRYVIKTGEQIALRFSRGGSKKKIAKTRILNLSDSGLAFWVDGRAIPHIGEIIKIEFETESRVTRYGRVVRLESPTEDSKNYDIQVAVEFLTDQAAEEEGLGVVLHGSFRPLERSDSRSLKGWLIGAAGLLAAAALVLVLI